MKSYTITVNGTAYEVTVEETGATNQTPAASAPVAPKAAKAPKASGKQGSVKINSPIEAMKLGMAYLPEDRKKDGILADLFIFII